MKKRKPMSKETKRKIGLANKGRKYLEESKKKLRESHLGQIPWNKGKPCSEKTKKKLSLANKGKKISSKTKKKLSEAMLLLGDNNPAKRPEVKEKLRQQKLGKKNPQFGKPAWNRGLKLPNLSGEKHHNWKGGVSSENKKIRISFKYKEWRNKIFARDNWTCQKCLERGGELHPHHIENFSSNKKLRFEVSNGITFCKKCHNKFHKIYGKLNNNIEQILQFIG